MSWIDPVTVTDISARAAVGLTAADLSYTEEDAATELGATNFSAAQALRQQAAVDVEGVLTSPDLVQQQATDEALATLSVRQRPRESAAAASARAAAG